MNRKTGTIISNLYKRSSSTTSITVNVHMKCTISYICTTISNIYNMYNGTTSVTVMVHMNVQHVCTTSVSISNVYNMSTGRTSMTS